MADIPVLNEETVTKIKCYLSSVPKEKADLLRKRENEWREASSTLFNSASVRFKSITKSMSTDGEFSSLPLSKITDDLAFLSAYYYHIIEIECVIMAKKTIYERCLSDNLNILKMFGAVGGRGINDFKAGAIIQGFGEYIIPVDKELSSIEQVACLFGISEKSQTSRSHAIKILIEAYKKRHDSLKEERMIDGKNR